MEKNKELADTDVGSSIETIATKKGIEGLISGIDQAINLIDQMKNNNIISDHSKKSSTSVMVDLDKKEEIDKELIFSYTAKIDELQKELANVKEDYTRLEITKNAQIEQQNETITNLHKKVNELTVKLEDRIKSDLSSLQCSADVDSLNIKIRFLENKIVESEKQKTDLEMKFREAVSVIDGLQCSINFSVRAIQRLSASLDKSVENANEKLGRGYKTLPEKESTITTALDKDKESEQSPCLIHEKVLKKENLLSWLKNKAASFL